MADLSSYDFSRSRAVLAEIRNVLRCPLCQDVAVNPYSLGNCSHFFCQKCLEIRHTGGSCPAPGCSASAPAKAAAQNKYIDSLTKSIFSIGKAFGEQIPDRVRRHMSTEVSDDDTEQDRNRSNTAPLTIQNNPSTVTETLDFNDDKPSEAEPFDPASTVSGRTKSAAREGAIRKRKSKITGRSGSGKVSKGSENETDLPSHESSRAATKTTARLSKAVGKSTEDCFKPEIDVKSCHEQEALTAIKTPKTKRASGHRRKVGSLEKRNLKGETSLHAAAVKGDLETARRLLEEGANPNTVDNAGWSPLHEASIAGRTDLVELLLEHGASPNLHAAEDNLTPLHDAASAGFIDVVKLLVARGADTKAKNSQGQTPMDVAAGKEILKAMEQTALEISSSQAHNQTIVQSGELTAEAVNISCATASDAEFKKIVQAASKLGLRKPSRAVSATTTHCLIDSPRDQFQILSTQLVGAVIVQSEWIFQSKQIGQLVDTEPFLLSPADLDQEGRSRSLDNRARGQPKLMTGLHFFLAGTFDSPGKSDLQKLITLSGARTVNREPDPENLPGPERTVPLHAADDSPLCRTSHVILYQAGGKREPVIKYKMEHVKTLPVSWFTESILQHRLIEPSLFLQ